MAEGDGKQVISENWNLRISAGVEFPFLQVNQDFIFKMGSLGNTGMILPSTPQACVNPLSPHITNTRKQPMSVTRREND